MNYLSICSGIEAASTAWQPLGMRAAAFAEIDPFASAVLKHRHPDVPNLGDFTKITADDVGAVDVLVGGTPCQSFSIAGLRGGLADDRGNLALQFLKLAQRLRPRWLVWENVPGVLSSNGGRDFGAILGGMVECGYGFAYRVLDAAYFGLAQRRKRVFVVGYLGDWRRAAAVLFERESLSWNPPPRRQARQRVAGPLEASSGRRGGQPNDHDPAGGLVSMSLNAKGGSGRLDAESETFVTHTLCGEGFDASEDGTGRGTPLVAFALGSHAGAADGDQTNRSHAKGGPVGSGISEELSYSLRAGRAQNIAGPSAVRRLTPRECERLQGFPDDHTLVPYRGKPAADGPRYRAIGNSMAVPVMAWLGRGLLEMEPA